MKGIIVYQVDVGRLSAVKAEAFCERLRDRLKEDAKEKFADWGLIVIPVRHDGNRVFVYWIEGEAEVNEIEPLVMAHGKWLNAHGEETREEVVDFVKIMIGALVTPLDQSVLDAIAYYVNRAFDYDVNNKKQYVLEEVQDRIEELGNGVLHATGFEEEDEEDE